MPATGSSTHRFRKGQTSGTRFRHTQPRRIGPAPSPFSRPLLDCYELLQLGHNKWELQLEETGIAPEELQIELEGRCLELRMEENERGKNYTTFKRIFVLPFTASPMPTYVHYTDGTLFIGLSK